jgi:hypothetical protein
MMYGEMRNSNKILARQLEENRPCGTPRQGWDNNNGMDLKEICQEGVGWISLAQDRNQW